MDIKEIRMEEVSNSGSASQVLRNSVDLVKLLDSLKTRDNLMKSVPKFMHGVEYVWMRYDTEWTS